MPQTFVPMVALACLLTSSAVAADFYVAADGDDKWTGTLESPNADKTDGPFATFERACEALRAKPKPAGGVTVHVRAGKYTLGQTLRLGKEDSGSSNSPIEFRAYRDEKPVLIGGRAITAWTVERERVLKADLAVQGLKGVYFRQLIWNGQRQHLARYPNFDPRNPYGGGWAYVDGESIPMYQDIPGEDKRTLIFKPSDARKWSKPTDGEVFIFARYNWWNNIVRIESLDASARKIALAGDCSYAIRPGDRYFVRNLREELDAPGEWYLDRDTWTLYFQPPDPAPGSTNQGDHASPTVYAPTMRTILEMGPGTEHVTFRGLTFECCEGTAVVLRETSHCRIVGCTIRNVGDYNGSGVSVDGGNNNEVVGCDICETGSHGISLSGGDRKTLKAAENCADNNYIHHVGVFYKQGVGIALNGIGNRASHNLIHDGPRMGIMFSGNNLRIEYNHIRHMNLETEDTGAVYTGGRDWISSRGTVILGNYFHDILGYGRDGDRWVSPHFAWGVYLDDNAGGVDVIGNLIVRCPRAGLHLHNGRDNKIENNIFVESRLQQIEYNGWTKDHPYWRTHLQTMIEGYEMVANQPAWKSMRNMLTHPKDAVLPDGKIMSGNVFRKNIIYYRNPEAKLFSFHNVPLDHYESDHNLVWHFGQPLVTGQSKAGKAVSRNVAINPGFELGKLAAMPSDWSWQMRPAPSQAESVADTAADGERSLRMTGGVGKEANGREFFPQVVGTEFSAKSGRSYRLAAKLRSDRAGARASVMLQSYVANSYFWGSTPNEVTVGTEWTDSQFVFRIPSPGDGNYHEQMKLFRIRIDFRESTGTLWVDDVRLHEVEMLDEWSAWQALGFDKHSVVADPLFMAPDRDDYRLQPDSPALKLGFFPIPLDRIGPYQHEYRATWPIAEAEGAREKPLSP